VRGRTVRTPERVAEAQRLRAEGLTWREVGARLGVSLKTAHEWATDPDGAIRDARKASYQGVCEECGGPTNGGDGPGSAPPLCRACLVVWSPEAVIVLDEWLAAVAAGESVASIAERYDVTPAAIYMRFRTHGYSVPAVRNGRAAA
jgi:hypothetical protein